MIKKHYLLAAAACSLIAAPAFAEQGQFNTAQETAIQKIVHEYIVKNPQVLLEASRALQERQQVQMMKRAETAIADNAKAIFESKSPSVGAKNGNVFLVEFFDYQCIHCKHMSPVIAKLVEGNKNLKVVLKQFPIFGPVSNFASRAAIAAEKQGKFYAFHESLLKQKERLTQDKILAIAKASGLNLKQLKQDMNSDAIKQQVQGNMELAKRLGLVGTPAFIVGNNGKGADAKSFFVPGASNVGVLQKLINKAKPAASAKTNS